MARLGGNFDFGVVDFGVVELVVVLVVVALLVVFFVVLSSGGRGRCDGCGYGRDGGGPCDGCSAGRGGCQLVVVAVIVDVVGVVAVMV